MSPVRQMKQSSGGSPVLVCTAGLRPAVRRLVHAAAPRLAVLSYSELGPRLDIETIGQVNIANSATV